MGATVVTESDIVVAILLTFVIGRYLVSKNHAETVFYKRLKTNLFSA